MILKIHLLRNLGLCKSLVVLGGVVSLMLLVLWYRLCVQRCSSLAEIKGIGKGVLVFFGALTGLSILKMQMECKLANRLLKSIGLGKMIVAIYLKTRFGIEVYVLC